MKNLDSRYVNQTDDYGCAPIALTNLMIWAKIYSSPFQGRLYDLCRTDGEGTWDKDFLKALICITSTHPINLKYYKYKNLRNIKNHLRKKDCSVLVAHLDFEGTPHWSFWYGVEDNLFAGINYKYPEVRTFLTESDVKTLIGKSGEDFDVLYLEKK